MRVLSLLCAGIAPVASRVYTGTFGSDAFPFMGRFAFGPNGGKAAVSIAGSAAGTNPLSTGGWWDTNWCAGPLSAPDTNAQPISEAAPTAGFPVISSNPPHFWYFSTYCALPGGCAPPQTLNGDTFTLTVTQSDGGHLSYEEVGLPAVYAVFWVWTAALVGAFIWALYFAARPAAYPAQLPVLTRALMITLALHTLSNLAHLIEWGFLSNTGKPSGAFLAVVGGLLRLAASGGFWVMAAIVATGYGVSTLSVGTYKDANNIKGVVALALLVLVGFILSIYFGATASAAGGGPGNPKYGCSVAQSGNAAGIWAGLIFLALTFAYLAFVIIRWRMTLAAEASLPRKTLLTSLGYTVIACFFILPIAEICGA